MNELAQAHTFFDTLRKQGDQRFSQLQRTIASWQLDHPAFYQRLHDWFSLFEAADRELALRLLLGLDYYSESRLEAEFKLRMDQLSLKDIHLTGPHQNAQVVLPDNKVDSAYRHGWLISKLEDIPGKQVVDLATLDSDHNPFLVFINDTHGSGKQFLTGVWPKLEAQGIAPGRVVIVAIAIAQAAHALFRAKGFVVIPDDDAQNAHQFFNPADIDRLRALGQRLEPERPLGFGDTALLLAYHFQCPNNTLPLIWSHGNERFRWNPLFAYRQKTRATAGSPQPPQAPTPARAADDAPKPADTAHAQPPVSVGERGIYVGGSVHGDMNTGTKVNTAGGAYFGGNVTAGGDVVGRDKTTHYHAPADLDALFAPLRAVLAPHPQALPQVAELQAETAKAGLADDNRLAGLVEVLALAAPGAGGELAKLFAQPSVQGVAGPVTRYVLSKLKTD